MLGARPALPRRERFPGSESYCLSLAPSTGDVDARTEPQTHSATPSPNDTCFLYCLPQMLGGIIILNQLSQQVTMSVI